MSPVSISPTISRGNVLRELGLLEPPTVEDLDRWRNTTRPDVPAGSVGSALHDQLHGLTARNEAGSITVRWFAMATVNQCPSVFALIDVGAKQQTSTMLEMIYLADVASVPARDDAHLVATIALERALRGYAKERPHAEGSGSHPIASCDVLKGVVHAIAAPIPARSTGQWIIEHCTSELCGELGRASLDDGGQATLDIHNVHFTEWMHGYEIRLSLRLVIWDASGTITKVMEQTISGDAFSVKLMYEPQPDDTRQAAALVQLRRWRIREARRFAARGESTRNLLPCDVISRAPLCALCLATLNHGAPGQAPMAGTLGPTAVASAARLRELSIDEIDEAAWGSEVVRAYEVDGFIILFELGVMAATAGGSCEILTFDRIRLGRGSEPPVAILYAGVETCSADGDHAAFRLFVEWLRMALHSNQVDPLDRPFGDGLPPSEWLRFGERGGETIDHRIETGILSSEDDYCKMTADESGFVVAPTDDPASAQWLLRFFVRHVIDPEARWEVGRAVASSPWDQLITRPTLD